jgi:hypothetical protein
LSKPPPNRCVLVQPQLPATRLEYPGGRTEGERKRLGESWWHGVYPLEALAVGELDDDSHGSALRNPRVGPFDVGRPTSSVPTRERPRKLPNLAAHHLRWHDTSAVPATAWCIPPDAGVIETVHLIVFLRLCCCSAAVPCGRGGLKNSSCSAPTT